MALAAETIFTLVFVPIAMKVGDFVLAEWRSRKANDLAVDTFERDTEKVRRENEREETNYWKAEAKAEREYNAALEKALREQQNKCDLANRPCGMVSMTVPPKPEPAPPPQPRPLIPQGKRKNRWWKRRKEQ